MPIEQSVIFGTSSVRRHFQDKARKLGKRERTRAAIMDGVVATVADKGIAFTTVKEIGESSGISHGTFYNHFDSREHALQETTEAIAIEVITVVSGSLQPTGEPDVDVVMGIFAFMKLASARPPWGKLLVLMLETLDGMHEPSSEPLQVLLKIGVKSGVFKSPITPLLSQQIGAIITLAISKKIAGTEVKRLFEDTCETVLRILGCTPEGATTCVKKALRT